MQPFRIGPIVPCGPIGRSRSSICLRQLGISGSSSQRHFVLTQTGTSILAGEATVELHTALGFWPLVAMLPVIHGLSVMAHVFPALGRRRKLLSNGLVILFVSLLGLGVWFNASFRHHLEGEGYAHCEALSQSMTFSSFEIYLQEPARCPSPRAP